MGASSPLKTIAQVIGLQSALDAQTPRNTVILFGDSLSAQSGTGPSVLAVAPISDPSAFVPGVGYWIWANAYLGQRASLVRNAGVGGDTVAMMRARIQTDVMPYPSGWVVFMGGANDVVQGRSLAAIQSDITFILDTLSAAGRRVLIMTAPPSANYDTAPERAVLAGLNKWIHGLPLARLGVYVVDAWRVLADPATGYPATGMATDSVHFTSSGAQRVGRAMFNVLDPLMPRNPSRVLGLTDPDNICGNPHFGSGTGWSTLGSDVSVAYATADDRWSSKATLTITGVENSTERGIQYVEPVAAGRYAAGDIVQATVRLRWSNATPVTSATGLFQPFLRIWPRKADGSWGVAILGMIVASSSARQPVGNQIASGDIVAATFRMALPANVANLYIGVGWQGMSSGTIEVSDLAVYKNAGV